MLLTASSDGTARMWCKGSRSGPVLVFRGTNRNDPGGGVKPTGMGSGGGAGGRSGTFGGKPTRTAVSNPSFPGDINGASFFYMDKFVLLSASRNVYMYSYLLDSFEVRCQRLPSASVVPPF